ncbi:hypothetical protein GTP44_26720, partial [Duganella sp. FT50W]
PAAAAALRAAGQALLRTEVAQVTLDQVAEEHLDGALHFLHCGGSHAEALAALAGCDLARWAPWIVVLAAGPAPAALTAAGYTLAYEDGWKQYLVAPHQRALAAALRQPPHPADDFRLCEDHPYSHPLDEWRRRTTAAETEAATSRQWAQDHVTEWKQKYALYETVQTRADTLDAELQRVLGVVEQQAASLEHDRQHYLEQHALLDQRLQAENARAVLAEQQLPPLSARAEQAERQLAERLAQLERLEAQRAEQQARAEQAEQQLPDLYARAAAADQAEATVHGMVHSVSWRLTRPLREANHFRQRLQRYVRRFPGRARGALVRRVKGLLGAGFRYVNRRPALSFFLRRNIARLPFLVPLARQLHLRLKLSQSNGPAPQVAPADAPAAVAVAVDTSHLPDTARRLFDDLRRRAHS